MHSYNLQQETALLEGQLITNGVGIVYDFLDNTETIDIGISGYHSYQAARSFKKAITYFFAPIPSIADEGFAFGYAIKGTYHLLKSWREIAK